MSDSSENNPILDDKVMEREDNSIEEEEKSDKLDQENEEVEENIKESKELPDKNIDSDDEDVVKTNVSKHKRAIIDDDSDVDTSSKSPTKVLDENVENNSKIVNKLKNLCDEESSSDEDDESNNKDDDEEDEEGLESVTNQNEKTIKSNGKTNKSSKTSKDFDGIQILQKNAREAEIEVPYHCPEKFELKDFLQKMKSVKEKLVVEEKLEIKTNKFKILKNLTPTSKNKSTEEQKENDDDRIITEDKQIEAVEESNKPPKLTLKGDPNSVIVLEMGPADRLIKTMMAGNRNSFKSVDPKFKPEPIPGAPYKELKETLEKQILQKRKESINKILQTEHDMKIEDEEEDDDEYEIDSEDETTDKKKKIKSKKSKEINYDEEEDPEYDPNEEEIVENEDDNEENLIEQEADDDDEMEANKNEENGLEDEVGEEEEDDSDKEDEEEDDSDEEEEKEENNEEENEDLDINCKKQRKRIVEQEDSEEEDEKEEDKVEEPSTPMGIPTIMDEEITGTQAELELMGLCSGKFPTQIPISTQSNLEATQDDGFCFDVPEMMTQNENEETQNPDEEEQVVQKPDLSSSEDEEKKEVTSNKKKLKKKRKVYIENDDEEEEDEDFGEELEEDDEEIPEVNEELEEYHLAFDGNSNPKPQRMKVGDFIEKEAELSDSEWESEDEDERGLDELDHLDLANDDEFDKDELREQVGRIHMRQMANEDDRELKYLKELMLNEEEKDGEGRQRTFRWLNINNDDFNNTTNNPDDPNLGQTENNSSDEENEENWRKIRFEREELINKKQGEVKIESKLSMVIRDTKDIKVIKPIEAADKEAKEYVKPSFLMQDQSKYFMSLKNSFLLRDEQTLSRLATISAKATEFSNSVSEGKQNFVFRRIENPKAQEQPEPQPRKRKSEGFPAKPKNQNVKKQKV